MESLILIKVQLLTVLVCSKLNKTCGLTSEPFIKGMFLLENFRRDLGSYKSYKQINVYMKNN